MLSKPQISKPRKSDRGFTIIEVMIVLAIAGLILLIVFLAVPALQRSARNTAIKNDASAIAGGISEFASNNDGALPTGAKSTYATGIVSLNNATGSPTQAKVQGSDVVTFGDATVSKVTPAAGSIYVDFGAKCGVTSGTDSTPTAQPRATAIIYAVEQSGANEAVCLDT